MDYKVGLTVFAVGIGIVSILPYYRDIFKKKTKPHVFSWFLWGLLTAIAFFAQLAKGGGVGSWVTGFTSLSCFFIAVLSLYRGEKDITTLDWVSFILAIFGIVLWQLTNNPLTAVLIVTAVDALACVPTYRKGYFKPFEETVSTYVLSSVKFIPGFFALESLNLTTWLYPVSIVVTNLGLVCMLLWRRKQLSKLKTYAI